MFNKKYINSLNDTDLAILIKQSSDYRLAKYIKYPSPFIMTMLVTKWPVSIKFIKNPTEEVQTIAVSKLPLAIKYIKNPSVNVQTTAIIHDASSFKFIKHPAPLAEIEYIKNIRYDFSQLLIDYKARLKLTHVGVLELLNYDNGISCIVFFPEKIRPTNKEIEDFLATNNNLSKEKIKCSLSYLGKKSLTECDFLTPERQLELLIKFEEILI